MATIGIAIFCCLIRPTRRAYRKSGPCFTANNIIVDFLNGTVIVPFLLMLGSAFSQAVLQDALKTNKLYLAIGAVIGLTFIFREFINGDQSQQVASEPVTTPITKVASEPRRAANSPTRASKSKSSKRR